MQTTAKTPPEPPVRSVVLDILKPHRPTLLELGTVIGRVKSVQWVDMSVYAVDEKTESVKATIEGDAIDFEAVRKAIEDSGGVIHSMDKVAIGRRL